MSGDQIFDELIFFSSLGFCMFSLTLILIQNSGHQKWTFETVQEKNIAINLLGRANLFGKLIFFTVSWTEFFILIREVGNWCLQRNYMGFALTSYQLERTKSRLQLVQFQEEEVEVIVCLEILLERVLRKLFFSIFQSANGTCQLTMGEQQKENSCLDILPKIWQVQENPYLEILLKIWQVYQGSQVLRGKMTLSSTKVVKQLQFLNPPGWCYFSTVYAGPKPSKKG